MTGIKHVFFCYRRRVFVLSSCFNSIDAPLKQIHAWFNLQQCALGSSKVSWFLFLWLINTEAPDNGSLCAWNSERYLLILPPSATMRF
jgi:hypothetical protein